MDFEQELSSLRSVYALVSTEAVLVDEAVAALRARVLVRAAEFNRDEFIAADTPIERVLEAAWTMPMMADKRFVHLRGFHEMKAKEHPPLIAYLEKPAAHTVLCLSGEKVDQRTKLGQALAKSGALFTFEIPRQQELAGFIARRAAKRGLRVENEAAQLLADLIGPEVGNLDRALDKAALHAGANQAVTFEDIEATSAPTRVHSIFELTDAVGQRDLGRASLLLRNVLSASDSGLPVLAMITRQVRQLLQVKVLKAQGKSGKEIASLAGVRPFLVDALVTQAKRYQEPELYAALEAALAADVRMKSTRLEHGVVLDRLLVEIMGAAH